MRATTLPDAAVRADPLDFADVLVRTESDCAAIRDFEAEVAAEELQALQAAELQAAEKLSRQQSSEAQLNTTQSSDWGESMARLDSLSTQSSDLGKSDSMKVGSLMNGAI